MKKYKIGDQVNIMFPFEGKCQRVEGKIIEFTNFRYHVYISQGIVIIVECYYLEACEAYENLLEQKEKEINHLHKQNNELRSEITVLNSMKREGN